MFETYKTTKEMRQSAINKQKAFFGLLANLLTATNENIVKLSRNILAEYSDSLSGDDVLLEVGYSENIHGARLRLLCKARQYSLNQLNFFEIIRDQIIPRTKDTEIKKSLSKLLSDLTNAKIEHQQIEAKKGSKEKS